MDAWLPEYSQDPRGHSIVVVRNTTLAELLKNSSTVHLQPLAIDHVKRSQLGVIMNKRCFIKERLSIAEKQKLQIPQKRTHLMWRNSRLDLRLEARFKYKISQVSPLLWLESGKNKELFTKRIWSLQFALKTLRRVRMIVRHLISPFKTESA